MTRSMLAIPAVGILLLASPFATAQKGQARGRGPSGPPITDHGRMKDRSNRPVNETADRSGTRKEKHLESSSRMTVGDKLDRNTHLASGLQSLFPPGTDLKEASSGFKNLGQFVAAAHVSKNLGIPFDQLKEKMTGETPVRLGEAIKELKPEASVKEELKKARNQTQEDLKQAETSQKLEESKNQQ